MCRAAEEFVDLLLDSPVVASARWDGVSLLPNFTQLRRHHPDQRDDNEDDHDGNPNDVACRQENDAVHVVEPFLLFAAAGTLIRAMADRMSVSACTLRSL